jgi:hypothetical protein
VYKYFEKISDRWKYNIKMGVIKIRYNGVDCIHLAKVRAHWQASVNTTMNPRVLCKRVNYSEELSDYYLFKN